MNLTAPLVIGLMHQFQKQKPLLKAGLASRRPAALLSRTDEVVRHAKPGPLQPTGIWDRIRQWGTDHNVRQFLRHLNNGF